MATDLEHSSEFRGSVQQNVLLEASLETRGVPRILAEGSPSLGSTINESVPNKTDKGRPAVPGTHWERLAQC
jgi:hypothetical protein